MKTLLSLAGSLVLGSLAMLGAGSQPTSVNGDSDFAAFLRQFEQGVSRFVNGDATLWKQHTSQRDDVTIMGGFGAYEKGGREVGERYDWAAAMFRPSGAVVRHEYLAQAVGGDLAYTVSIERSQAQVAGASTAAAMALRVTHVFRKEHGAWKLVHRHADPMVAKVTPSAVLER